MKILIVDDSPLVRAILKDCLKAAGYEVSEAATFREAEQEFSQFHPEVVIKDLYMPDWDAIESVFFFKNADAKVKVIICSTNSSKATLIKALKAGAQDFILKPIDKSQVLNVLKRVTAS